jgi:hypothetical protein
MLRLLVAALLVAQTGCIIVGKRNPPPSERRGGGDKVVHEHCHPKKHGREVCHAHPHYDPGHH